MKRYTSRSSFSLEAPEFEELRRVCPQPIIYIQDKVANTSDGRFYSSCLIDSPPARPSTAFAVPDELLDEPSGPLLPVY